MNKHVLELNKNGYTIIDSVPFLELQELKETLINIIKKSYLKNIGKLDVPQNEDYVLNNMFIELENKSHSFITKIFDSVRLTSSDLKVVTSPKHIEYCKKLFNSNENFDLFINSMSVRMDPPKSTKFSYGWHTDGDVNINKSVFIQSWTPLVDINEELGGLEIIENSHINEVKTEHTDLVNSEVKKGNRLTNLLCLQPPHDRKIITPEAKQKILTANFGQTIFFSNKLMHRSGINLSKNKVRLALTAFYHRSDIAESDWY